MAGVNEDRNRQVIPRWRTFQATVGRGELSSLKAPRDVQDQTGRLDELLQDRADRRSISVAADLVSAAFVNAREADAADAARFILANETAPYGAKRIAAICLRNLGEAVPDTAPADDPQGDNDPQAVVSSARGRLFQAQIHATREQLADYPWNAVLWSNLARLYTCVGSQHKATRAMRVALGLAPENRFILRSASRLLLHQGEGQQAHRLLTAAQCLQYDPWVLSAEIATAAAIGRTSKQIKHARKLLEFGRFSSAHVSELASALGTHEAAAGNRRLSRVLINQSLRQPSENAVAQAAWLARNVGVLTTIGIDVTRSDEALAWQAFRVANWSRSIEGARGWFADQPFSSRPAIHGSHITATIYEDYTQAVEFAEAGLLSNPDDVCLYNNLAFALAQQGEAERAAQVLRRIDLRNMARGQYPFVTATAGLIEFRRGHPELGRALYRRALEHAHTLRDAKAEMAYVYLAFEELRIGSPEAEEVRQAAIEATEGLTDSWCRTVIERLRNYRRPSGDE
jgi:tetratricopeptide (TPR) repeat protein